LSILIKIHRDTMSKIMFNKVEILLKTLLINKRSTAKRDCKVFLKELHTSIAIFTRPFLNIGFKALYLDLRGNVSCKMADINLSALYEHFACGTNIIIRGSRRSYTTWKIESAFYLQTT